MRPEVVYPVFLVLTVLLAGQWWAAWGRCRKCRDSREPSCACTDQGDVRKPKRNGVLEDWRRRKK